MNKLIKIILNIIILLIILYNIMINLQINKINGNVVYIDILGQRFNYEIKE